MKRPHVVAVVDDDPSLRKALARLLTTLGYRVELFASSEALMNASGSLEGDMPRHRYQPWRWVGPGPGAPAFQVRVLAVPIIFMTGGQDDVIRRQCLDFGCVAFLLKPFTEEGLVEAIAEATRPSRKAG